MIDYHHKKHNYNGNEYSGKNTEWFSAPTHQMAMKWFRDIHKIHIEIWATYDTETEEHTGWGITVTDLSDFGGVYLADASGYKTYEEATEAALIHVLTNLI